MQKIIFILAQVLVEPCRDSTMETNLQLAIRLCIANLLLASNKVVRRDVTGKGTGIGKKQKKIKNQKSPSPVAFDDPFPAVKWRFEAIHVI